MKKLEGYRPILWTLGATLLGVFLVNVLSQPYEDSISVFPRGKPFYLDYVWYVDDVLAPALFISGGLLLVFHTPIRALPGAWPVALLGMFFIALGLGDTLDAHWVATEGTAASDELKSFGSFGSKIMSVVALGFALIYGWEFFTRRAAKALLFAYLLITINQIHMAISLEFAGFTFHVMEELVEVVAAAFLLMAVCKPPLEPGIPRDT